MQVLRLVEFACQRYYRLDCSSERGLCERQSRTTERVSAALRPAALLAQAIKDMAHPQDQAWMRHLFSDAALNRFKHLEAGSGLRANSAPQVVRAQKANKLDALMEDFEEGQQRVRHFLLSSAMAEHVAPYAQTSLCYLDAVEVDGTALAEGPLEPAAGGFQPRR